MEVYRGGEERVLEGVKQTHVFSKPGTYKVALKVRDKAGNESTDTLTVEILPKILPPTDKSPPRILKVEQKPEAFKPNRPTRIIAHVVDEETGVENVVLYFRVDRGEWRKVSMQRINGELWSGEIPGQREGSTVKYYVEAVDEAGNRKATSTHTSKVKAVKARVGLMEASSALAEASAYILDQKLKGYDVSQAEKYLSEAYLALNQANYERACKLAEKASKLAVDIDQDGIPNTSDPFPTVNNNLIYGGIGALIAAVLGVVVALRKRASLPHQKGGGGLGVES